MRITPDFNPKRVGRILLELYAGYDPERQAEFARQAKSRFDYRAEGRRLAQAIEEMRKTYQQEPS